MSDLLDLDALLPPSKQVKINGKLYECKPLTIRQLIEVAKLEEKLAQAKNEDEILQSITDALAPIIPAIVDDKNIDLTIEQMKKLIEFAQQISTPEATMEAKKYDDPKKKINSQEELHTSSDSTEDTQSTQSSNSTQ